VAQNITMNTTDGSIGQTILKLEYSVVMLGSTVKVVECLIFFWECDKNHAEHLLVGCRFEMAKL
jgi:hypothetical protein